MKQKVLSLILVALMAISAIGCGSKEPNVYLDPAAKSLSAYKINAESSIESDFELLNPSKLNPSDDLALSDICCMFPDGDTIYFYFQMPTETESAAYRVTSVTIDDRVYPLTWLETDGHYQKYCVEAFHSNADGQYHLTRIEFADSKHPDQTSTYTISQFLTMETTEDTFTFRQKYEYAITLNGQNFESVYRFNKENNCFVDLWSNIVGDVETLDEDDRTFFYFAFNCKDVVRNTYFEPKDISELEVEFTRLNYEYEGKDSEAARNITPAVKTERETIKKEQILVTSGNKRSNQRPYEYHTINKLDEANLTLNHSNVANVAVLQQAARQYDWAVQFGNRQGYPYTDIEAGWLWNHTNRVRYTHVENFHAIRIKYTDENGHKVNTRVNTLLNEAVTTVVEPTAKPRDFDIVRNRIAEIWKDPHKSFAEKLVETWAVENGKYVVALVVTIVSIFVVFVLGKLAIFWLRRKHAHDDDD